MEYADQLRFRGEALLYAIDDAASGQLLGAVDLLLNPRDPGIGEIAYMLGAHARGRGVMTAAVRLLCAHVFDNLGVRRVELLHHPDNHASAAVAVRAGFVREGVLRAYRVKKTHVAEARLIYSLLDTDV
jgi:RimJ/RimL family protein N-acetyltransferase